jgi:hypothetical protein
VNKRDKFMQRLLAQGIKPHAEEIEGVWREHGEVAVVFFELTPALREEMARAFLWNGDAAVVRMPPEVARRIVSECKERGDEVTPRWLTDKRGWPPWVGRIFVVAHAGATLLVNYEPGEGFSVEPGSTAAGWMS